MKSIHTLLRFCVNLRKNDIENFHFYKTIHLYLYDIQKAIIPLLF